MAYGIWHMVNLRKQSSVFRISQRDVHLRPDAVIAERRDGASVEIGLHLGEFRIVPVLGADAQERRRAVDRIAAPHNASEGRGNENRIVEALVIAPSFGNRDSLLIAAERPYPIEY